jgi:hypothetical protein
MLVESIYVAVAVFLVVGVVGLLITRGTNANMKVLRV